MDRIAPENYLEQTALDLSTRAKDVSKMGMAGALKAAPLVRDLADFLHLLTNVVSASHFGIQQISQLSDRVEELEKQIDTLHKKIADTDKVLEVLSA